MGFLNMRAQTDKMFLFKNLNIYKINKLHHGKCFVRFYSLVEEYKESHSFATLTRSFSDTPQLVNKNRNLYFLKNKELSQTFWPGMWPAS